MSFLSERKQKLGRNDIEDRRFCKETEGDGFKSFLWGKERRNAWVG